MYITTAYLYQQKQPVLMVDTSGDHFNARWSPVYAKSLKINRGVDNVLMFQFQNQDQRAVNVDGYQFVFRVLSQNGKHLLYATELVQLHAATGRAKVVIPAADTLRLQPQPASWSIEQITPNMHQAVFVDDSAGARGTVDIVDSVLPQFTASKTLTLPDLTDDSKTQFSSTIDTDGNSMLTFQFELEQFTGTISARASTGLMAETTEWYSTDLVFPASRVVVPSVYMENYTGVFLANTLGFHPMLQLVVESEEGRISNITYR